jgi:hypothetical protein
MNLSSERHEAIASADDITREIAVLKDRLSTLDRERSEIADRLSVLEYAQTREATRQPPQLTSRVMSASSAAEKIALFRDLFRGREEVFPRRWENAQSGKAGYAPVCRNECGSEESAASRRSSAENAPIRHLSRSATTFCDPISRGKPPVARSILPLGFIPCCLTRHAGFSLPISTGSPGSRTLPHSAILHEPKVSLSQSNDRARAMGLMRGSSSGNLWGRLTPGASERSSLRQRWIAVLILASIRMTGSFRARTRCRPAGSAI